MTTYEIITNNGNLACPVCGDPCLVIQKTDTKPAEKIYWDDNFANIQFDCQCCGNYSRLTLWTHEGMTMVKWSLPYPGLNSLED